MSRTPETPIYTIGYGARSIEAFLNLLKSFEFSYLIDVRTTPYSSYKPEFSRQSLKNKLETNGVRYLFMGETLGGQPADNACYRGGKVDYELVAWRPNFLDGINNLHDVVCQGRKVVLMCSEGKPEHCHRSKLIGKALASQGINVLHIDEKDELIDQKQVIIRLTNGQLSLFGDDFLNLTSRKRHSE
jgi:uncharacterized protein (DUF488 family)